MLLERLLGMLIAALSGFLIESARTVSFAFRYTSAVWSLAHRRPSHTSHPPERMAIARIFLPVSCHQPLGVAHVGQVEAARPTATGSVRSGCLSMEHLPAANLPPAHVHLVSAI